MKIHKNISLKNYNTFGIDAKARFFCEISTLEHLSEALKLQGYDEKFIIGGGSNLLLTKTISGLVLHINMKGKEIVAENEDNVTIKVMAGENWHQLVLWTIEKDFGGLENMSLIPGKAGAAPIQNIGAYGVELKDSFHSCEAMDISTQRIKTFSKDECRFGYRESFFKNEGLGKYIITSINLKLTKRNHKLHTTYGAIDKELEAIGIKNPTIKDISNVVITIRKSKLPDPKVLGNSGSFFKNPIIDKTEFLAFSKKYPDAPFFKIASNEYKIPAGWLIEQCGFKGKRFGNAGVHANQALVIVNYGKATGEEILTLADQIVNDVYSKFNIRIFYEVHIVK